MRGILLLALNDVRLTVRERSSFIWMLLLPIALMWFFGQLGSSGETGPPKFSLSVADQDRGWLARALVEDLEGDSVRLDEVGPADAERAEGAVRTLVIPPRFTEQVLAGNPQELRLEKASEASEEFSLAAEVHVIRSLVRIVGRLVEIQSDLAPEIISDPDTASSAMRKLGRRPALVTLDVSTAGRGRPVPRGLAQSVPGILTMMVLMMTLIYGGVFLTLEKRERMLERLTGSPLLRRHIFLGKLTGRLLVAGMQIAVLVLVGRFLFGLSFGGSPAALLLLLVCYAVAVAGLATLVGAAFSTPEQASTVGWISSMVLAALGGCWWPSEVMPRWLWKAAHLFPTAWAMDGFHALISFGQGLGGVLLPSAVLILFGAIFSLIGARLLKAT